jgi:hypothetical protein
VLLSRFVAVRVLPSVSVLLSPPTLCVVVWRLWLRLTIPPFQCPFQHSGVTAVGAVGAEGAEGVEVEAGVLVAAVRRAMSEVSEVCMSSFSGAHAKKSLLSRRHVCVAVSLADAQVMPSTMC